jgi:hypothetical protein
MGNAAPKMLNLSTLADSGLASTPQSEPESAYPLRALDNLERAVVLVALMQMLETMSYHSQSERIRTAETLRDLADVVERRVL